MIEDDTLYRPVLRDPDPLEQAEAEERALPPPGPSPYQLLSGAWQLAPGGTPVFLCDLGKAVQLLHRNQPAAAYPWLCRALKLLDRAGYEAGERMRILGALTAAKAMLETPKS